MVTRLSPRNGSYPWFPKKGVKVESKGWVPRSGCKGGSQGWITRFVPKLGSQGLVPRLATKVWLGSKVWSHGLVLMVIGS